MNADNGTAEVVIDAEVEEIEPGMELAPAAAQAPTTLFRTDDPAEVLKRATETANALKDVLKNQNLTTNIKGKEHVNVEGWQTLGAMLGVTPVCTWTRPIDGGWEARVEARTLDGRVIGAAEAECLKAEGGPWGGADYARRSMAQTRATSKALGSVLRFVVTLAGYSGTPAEEMPRDGGAAPQQAAPAPPDEPEPDNPLDPEKVEEIVQGVKALGLTNSKIRLLLGSVGAEGPKINRPDSILKAFRGLTEQQADQVLVLLQRSADRANAEAVS